MILRITSSGSRHISGRTARAVGYVDDDDEEWLLIVD
jgi:hypothetical protein